VQAEKLIDEWRNRAEGKKDEDENYVTSLGQ
jgi:hypothetical protein